MLCRWMPSAASELRKESVLNIHSHKLTGLIAVLCLVTTLDAVGSPLVGSRLLSVAAAVGQADGRRASARERRQEVEDLLGRARQSMEAGHLETADSLLSRAEAMSVRFNLIDGVLRDTPKKARRDFERLEKRTGRSKRPSGLSKPQTTLEIREDSTAAKNGIIINPFIEDEVTRQPTSLSDEKRQARRYLAKGRAELSRGNIVGAKSWYLKAAQFGASFGPQEDSPERLAKDIRQSGGDLSNLAGPAAAARSDAASAILTPDMVEADMQGPLMQDRRGAADFDGRGGDANMPPSPFGGRPINAPPATQSLRAPGAPQGIADASNGQFDSRRQQSDSLLLEARRALAAGDVRQASQLTAQARKLGVHYGLHDDTPEKVDTLVRQADELIRRGREGRATEAYRQQLAQFLMQQADGLLAGGAIDDAERMARQAAQIKVNYAPFDATPQKLLERIAARRQAAESETANIVQQVTQPTEGSYGPPDAEAEKKHHVGRLLEQAKTAVTQGDLERADQLTRQAESIPLANAPQAASTAAARPMGAMTPARPWPPRRSMWTRTMTRRSSPT